MAHRPRRPSVHDPRRPLGPDHLFPEDSRDDGPGHVPRIARFLGRDGTPRIGLVVETSEGLPRRLLDLTARHGLGPGLLEMVEAGGFDIAARELEGFTASGGGDHVVALERSELADRLLSPVDIDADQLERGTRLVIGFGLTFGAHRLETGRTRPIVFPKPCAPTGAYAPVLASGGGAPGDHPASLLDYELELACVALRDIDLDRLDRVDPAAGFGYLVVNDVTAREPILRDRRAGFARAKGRPTYLPAGPWVVPGEHFTRDAPSLRRMVLTVDEGLGHDVRAGDPGSESGGRRHSLRQDARLDELTLGIEELLALVSRQRHLTMSGVDGRPWPISVERGARRIIPAGSLLLTGTPGGTAIRSPGFGDRLALLARGLRHGRRPSEDYRRHLQEHLRTFGFLAPGDRVSGWITGLGRQQWDVR